MVTGLRMTFHHSVKNLKKNVSKTHTDILTNTVSQKIQTVMHQISVLFVLPLSLIGNVTHYILEGSFPVTILECAQKLFRILQRIAPTFGKTQMSSVQTENTSVWTLFSLTALIYALKRVITL